MITEEKYKEQLRRFLTQSNDITIDRTYNYAAEQLQGMSLKDYLKDPIICYNGAWVGLSHNDIFCYRFSELLELSREAFKKAEPLINYYKILTTNEPEDEEKRIELLKKAKLHNLFKFHLLPYSDGNYYHWNIDIDNVYDRMDDHPLIPNIGADMLRQDPCVLYAERSASCGLFALVAADPNKMDIDKYILPIPNCCVGIKKDAAQDEITQFRYLCGRDEQWQPHDVTYCDNYRKMEVKKKTEKDDETVVTRVPREKSGLDTDILKGTVCDKLYEGATVEDGIYNFARENALFESLQRYNYTRSDLDAVPREHGSGWNNVKFKEQAPTPRLKLCKTLNCEYLNEAIQWGGFTLERGTIHIIPTGCGKTYALEQIKEPDNVFLTTRLGLVDEFGEKNSGQWERIYPTTTIVAGKQYYGTAQGITSSQIEKMKKYNYLFHLDELHSWFEFADLTDKLNKILKKKPNIIGYTASPTEQLMVWCEINNYKLMEVTFNRKKQKLSLQLLRYKRLSQTILEDVVRIIKHCLGKDEKIVLYLNDKKKIEQIKQALPPDSSFTYYTCEQKERETRDEWEAQNRSDLNHFKSKKGGACLLCTSKMGIGANFSNVVNTFIVFSNDPDSIQQIIARERKNDIKVVLYSITRSVHYLSHKVGWQDILDEYFTGDTTKKDFLNNKVYSTGISTSIQDLRKGIYEKHSEVFYTNLFYILQNNWDVENLNNNGSPVFPIAEVNKEEKVEVLSLSDIIYDGLQHLFKWHKEKESHNGKGLDHLFDMVDMNDLESPKERNKYLKSFINKYEELERALGLPEYRSLEGRPKEDVIQIIKKVLNEYEKTDKKVSLWNATKEVLNEKGHTASFSDADISEIEQEVKRRYPSFSNAIKGILKDHYRYDRDKGCWVKKSKKSQVTIQKEEDDKKILEHLKNNGKKITTKSVKEAMDALNIEGNPDTRRKRLNRKADNR